jgi:tetraprenyl-beta-curcumene synthase
LIWGLRAVSGEVVALRGRASAIPDAPIREDALASLASKRTHLDGAGLFWILPRRRNPRLLRLLVIYEAILEFLDEVNERGADAGSANGRHLHLALAEAPIFTAPPSDYYRHHCWKDDGGYLRALVETCRASFISLPAYALVNEQIAIETSRSQVLAFNHDPDPGRRDLALRRWVKREYPCEIEMRWFELSGAATASLTVHALLALAAEPASTPHIVKNTYSVYFPQLSLVTTMLDSYVDRAEDEADGSHSYIAHYGPYNTAVLRLDDLIQRSIYNAGHLHNGHRHAVIAACMVAMYLSKDSARESSNEITTRQLANAGGSLTTLLLPVLRMWRIAYALRSA